MSYDSKNSVYISSQTLDTDDFYKYDNQTLLNRTIISYFNKEQMIELIGKICDSISINKNVSIHKELFISWLNTNNINGRAFLSYNHVSFAKAIQEDSGQHTLIGPSMYLFKEIFKCRPELKQILSELCIKITSLNECQVPDVISIIQNIDEDKVKPGDKSIIIEYLQTNNGNGINILQFTRKQFGQSLVEYTNNKKIRGPAVKIYTHLTTKAFPDKPHDKSQLKLLHEFYKYCLMDGTEGINSKDCKIFFNDLDDNIKTKIKDVKSFSALKTIDNIIHFKLFQPLLNEVIRSDQGKKMEEKSQDNESNKIGVIQIAKIWDIYIDPHRFGNIIDAQWIRNMNKLNIKLNESKLKQIFAFMDKDRSESISKTEFILFCTVIHNDNQRAELQYQLLQSLFQNVETSRTHEIVSNETESKEDTEIALNDGDNDKTESEKLRDEIEMLKKKLKELEAKESSTKDAKQSLLRKPDF